MQNRPINSIVVYKDWLYSASDIVEGSNFKVRTLNYECTDFDRTFSNWRNGAGMEKAQQASDVHGT